MRAGQGRAVNANGLALGDLAQRGAPHSCPLPWARQPWLGPRRVRQQPYAPFSRPPSHPAPPRLCRSHGDPGEHLSQAALLLNIRANLDQQVLPKRANHLLFLRF